MEPRGAQREVACPGPYTNETGGALGGTAREFVLPCYAISVAVLRDQLFFAAGAAVSTAMSFVSSARAFGPLSLNVAVKPASLIAFATAR